MKKNIFFVHGFWVRKDARWMFTDIENYFSQKDWDYNFFYTDLNDFSEDGRDTFLKSLSEQAEILKETLDKSYKNTEENIIIAHSQWCVVASLLQDFNFSKIIFLAPPTNNDLNKTIANFEKRPWTVINKTWTSTLIRSDGNKTFVTAEYWTERKQLDYQELYKKFSQKHSIYVIFAAQDEIIANNTLDNLQSFDISSIDWNHNFEWMSRKYLVEILHKILK